MNYQVTSDYNNEILLINDNIKIYLDPKHINQENFVFISHAHMDHLLNKRNLKKFDLKNKIISSIETLALANLRGYTIIDNFLGTHQDFELLDNGHILGSKGLLVNNSIFYTGDVSIRKRAFLKSPRIPKAETLIIESTFGKPEYKFPPLEKIVQKVNRLISEMYSRGIPVILMGYSLGKAQVLTSLFGAWKPLIVHDDVYQFNELYKNYGIKLEESISLSEAKDNNILKNKPWVLIYPLTNGRQNYISHLKEKYGAITIGFSGWAINNNYCHIMNLDYVIPFSDHCDFDELVEVVKKSNPEKIYTFHGFQEEFANHLKSLGFDAEPINKQRSKKSGKPDKKKNETLESFL